jgi:hypothetical protein
MLPPVVAVTDAPMPMQPALSPAAPSATLAEENRTTEDITVVSTIRLNIAFPLAAERFAATAATLLLDRNPRTPAGRFRRR